MKIQSNIDEAQDLRSGLVLARPQHQFLQSYIDALKEGLSPARHQTCDEEMQSLLSGDMQVWQAFAETCVNSRDADNYCLEDLFWLTEAERFMGYIWLRSDLGPLRQKYGGNTGRELR